jgi:hypothetical protein
MYMVYTWSWVLLRIKCACESSAGLGCGLHTREPINSVTDGQKIFLFFFLRSCQTHTQTHTPRGTNPSQSIYSRRPYRSRSKNKKCHSNFPAWKNKFQIVRLWSGMSWQNGCRPFLYPISKRSTVYRLYKSCGTLLYSSCSIYSHPPNKNLKWFLFYFFSRQRKRKKRIE